jgi:Piwi domain
MSTRFKSEGAQSARPSATDELLLNGFDLTLSSETFPARQLALPDNKQLRDLRAQHPDWLVYWHEGFVYAVPRRDSPSTSIGDPVALRCSENLQFIAWLIDSLLPNKFPGYDAFRRRPFGFAGKKDELVGASAAKLRTKPPLLKSFTIRPTFILEAKIIETVPEQTSVGLFLTINTKWEIKADLTALQAAGVDLRGLYVIRRNPQAGERRLVGQIGRIVGSMVNLSAAYDDRTTVPVDNVYLEGSKTSFARCLKVLLGNDYESFEQTRQREEAKLLSGPAVKEMVGQFHQFFRKDPILALAEQLTATIGEQLKLTNTSAYQTIHHAAPVQYYFDPARTKASLYPWAGIKQYGPFSKDTFSKRTPVILVVLPDTAQGATEQFLNSFRNGLVTPRPQYEGGFAKLFSLLNPTFTLCKVPLLSESDPAKAYQRAIEESLAANSNVDAAIVVLTDQHAALPDTDSPYLTAKATLMLAGVPAQEIKVSRFAKQPYELQFLLANFAVALYAKMNGTPWTVNQDTTISDELIIGIGTSEVRKNRFSDRVRYIGITTVFRGDGNYLLSHVGKECSYEEYPMVLQESTERLLQEIKQRNGWNPDDNIRLIFHTYKPLKSIEIAEIAKRAALAVGSEQTIEFAFLTVTMDHPFLLVDPQQVGIKSKYGNRGGAKGVLVPERGTITQIGRYTRLVCTNGPSLIKHENAPLPAPLLVHIHKGSTFNDLTYLSEQVLKFTGLSWRSTLPAKKPVSIYYSELIAGLLGRLRSVPGWSPAILNTRLRASRWFL